MRTPRRRVKISATLEEDVVREIESLTDNVSGFLNDAAKRKLYYARLARFERELEAMGVPFDEEFYRRLLAKTDRVLKKLARPRRR